MTTTSCLRTLSIVTKTKGRISVPCGRCHACLKKRRHDWSFRLFEELRVAKTANFITLTYEDTNIPRDKKGQPELRKKHVQSFLKRLRAAQHNIQTADPSHTSSERTTTRTNSIRYYACGEYGSITDRPHYHIILFNLYSELKDKVNQIWGHGHSHIGTCNPKSIAYTTKYVLKLENYGKPQPHQRQKEFSLMSQGLGKNYVAKNKKYHQENKSMVVRNQSGGQQRLPRYFKEKIFTKGQIAVIAQMDQSKADLKQKQEERRIATLGNEVGQYQYDQLRATLNKADKDIKKSDKL